MHVCSCFTLTYLWRGQTLETENVNKNLTVGVIEAEAGGESTHVVPLS